MAEGELKIIGKLVEQFNPQTMDWLTYEDLLKNMLELNGIAEEKKKKMCIMSMIGMTAFAELKHAMQGKSVNDVSSGEMLQFLRDRYAPKKLVIAQRDKFLAIKQKPTQTFAELVAELQYIASGCEFDKITNAEQARECFMLQGFLRAVREEDIRVKLLQHEKLDFKKAYELACVYEQATKEGPSLGKSKENFGTYIGKVTKQSFRPRAPTPYGKKEDEIKCYACGKSGHMKSDCRYKEIECQLCGKKGHSAKRCFVLRDSDNEEYAHYMRGGRSESEMSNNSGVSKSSRGKDWAEDDVMWTHNTNRYNYSSEEEEY